jgi:hypothetical protein
MEASHLEICLQQIAMAKKDLEVIDGRSSDKLVEHLRSGNFYSALEIYLSRSIFAASINSLEAIFKAVSKDTPLELKQPIETALLETFAEILCLEFYGLNRIAREAILSKKFSIDDLAKSDTEVERFKAFSDSYQKSLEGVLKETIKRFQLFCEINDFFSDMDNEARIMSLFIEREDEYANFPSLSDSKKPKESLLWMAGKNISNSLVDSPDFQIILYVETGFTCGIEPFKNGLNTLLENWTTG